MRNIAHPPKHWTTDHAMGVAQKTKEFAKKFGFEQIGFQLGINHDLGKENPEFQAKINNEQVIRVDHSSVGAYFLTQFLPKPLATALGYIIAGHHAGLADYYPVDSGEGALLARVKKGKVNFAKIPNCDLEFYKKESKIEMEKISKRDVALWIRLLFSCLVDADWLDTEEYCDPDEYKKRTNKKIDESFLIKFNDYMSKKKFSNFSNELVFGQVGLQRLRNRILENCRLSGKGKPGIYTLNAATGAGKTLSSMGFALEHCIKHNKERIIYVIPYTSIIEQTSNIFAEIFGGDSVLEHHSNLAPEKETRENQRLCENWSAPLVVTTTVQFFESLFSHKKSSCRKLHNICNSVVILDEIQLLPPGKVDDCLKIINELSINYNVTFLITTATIFKSNIISVNKIETEDFPQRFDLKFIEGQISWSDLAKKVSEYNQVLCICNTKRDAFELWQELPEDTYLLTSLSCGEERSDLLKEIKSKLKDNLPVRVVSTQLIEAGVDIDFPVVFRAFTGWDSIIQAGGRCNREAKGFGRLFVFDPEKTSVRGLLKKAANACKEMLVVSSDKFMSLSSGEFMSLSSGEFMSLSSDEWGFNNNNNNNDNDNGNDSNNDNDITERFFEIFHSKIIKENNFDNLLPESYNLEISFRKVGEKFKIIDEDYKKTIFAEYNGKLISQRKAIQLTAAQIKKCGDLICVIGDYMFLSCSTKDLMSLLYGGKTCNVLTSETLVF
jgi:CRISPR-associated endonuclease/helicase Cas3